MHLTDSELNDYIGRALFFGPDEKAEYQTQIDHLKTTITNAIHRESDLKVVKINQAGSWRKGTALLPIAGQDVDIDLCVYLKVDPSKRTAIVELHNLIITLLRKSYPTKDPNDFTPSPKTVGIEFRQSGLLVDLVPVIPVDQPAGYVWQPENGGKGSFQTSPEGQLDFVQAVKDADSKFTQVVRLAKRWRNFAELEGFSSFAIELVVAHLNRKDGPPDTIEFGFIRFLLYLAQTGLTEAITFPTAIRTCPATTAPVRIYDPTNNENNVTARTTSEERAAVVAAANRSVQVINHAVSVGRKGETEKLWQSVLGPQFSI